MAETVFFSLIMHSLYLAFKMKLFLCWREFFLPLLCFCHAWSELISWFLVTFIEYRFWGGQGCSKDPLGERTLFLNKGKIKWTHFNYIKSTHQSPQHSDNLSLSPSPLLPFILFLFLTLSSCNIFLFNYFFLPKFRSKITVLPWCVVMDILQFFFKSIAIFYYIILYFILFYYFIITLWSICTIPSLHSMTLLSYIFVFVFEDQQ